ncbi:MAG: preprotein translocase subunit SecG [Bacillota bacterium]
MLRTVLTAVHFLVCAALVVAVLVQPERGSGLGVIGGGSTPFASKKRATEVLLVRLTTGLAAAFVITSVVVAFLAR